MSFRELPTCRQGRRSSIAGIPALLLIVLITFQLAAPVNAAEPPRWVVRDADSELVLFPTVHALPAELEWVSDAMLAQFEGAEEVWFEIDPAALQGEAMQKIVMERGMNPQQPLSELLAPEVHARFVEAAEAIGLPAAQLDPMRPWLASLTLSSMALMQSGFDSNAGVETQLQQRLSGQRVRSLESVEQQIGFLADLDESVQIEMLASTLDELDGFTDELRAVAEDWAVGDVSGMESLLVDQMKREYPAIYEVLFTRRNANWVETIEEELAGSGTDFMAVGAGHLVGEDSVVAMLRANGWTVERIGSGE